MGRKNGRKRPSGGNGKRREPAQWHKGKLCPIKSDKAWFIKPDSSLPDDYQQNKDVFLRPSSLPEHILPVKQGDRLDFVLGDRDKSKPMAMRVKVVEYCSARSSQELTDHLETLKSNVEREGSQVLSDMFTETTMWRMVASPRLQAGEIEDGVVAYVKTLMGLLQLILSYSNTYQANVRELMETMLQGNLFKESDGVAWSIPKLIKARNRNLSVQLIQEFCQDVIGRVRSVSRCLLPTIRAMEATQPNLTGFLMKFLSLVLSGEIDMVVNEDVWQELPFTPTVSELAGRLVEHDQHLAQVKSRYDNTDDYMDTYFRLLRAEAFSAVQHGIKDLMDDTLDSRDMAVYTNVALVGNNVQQGRYTLAVHFAAPKRSGGGTRNLMYGNLLCLTLDEQFNDVVWAVVASNDKDLLKKKNIVLIEILEENAKPMGDIVLSLQANAGSVVMVESPTYYRSIAPILRSLKDFQMDTFPLKEEIVYARRRLRGPIYLSEDPSENYFERYSDNYSDSSSDSSSERYSADRYIDPSPLYDGQPRRQTLVSTFLQNFNEFDGTILERSQCVALKSAFTNRLAIIQGPPGCGKTFIGVKMVQLLLSLRPPLEKPILVLTYKNHALDEFLKHVSEFCSTDDMVRIGGQSKEEKLQACRLREVRANLRHSKPTYENIQEIRNDMDEVTERVKELSGQLDAAGHMTASSFLGYITEEQLRLFLLDKDSGPTQKRVSSFNHVATVGGSVKQALQLCIDCGHFNDNEHVKNLAAHFKRTFASWMPDREQLRRMKQFQAGSLVVNEGDSDSDSDSEDEEYVQDVLNNRIIGSVQSNSDLLLFPSVRDRKDIVVDISDYPSGMKIGNSRTLQHVERLWRLSAVERFKFVYGILKERTSAVSHDLQEQLRQLELLRRRKEELEATSTDLELLRRRIIGVTITGASINRDLIHRLDPSVVIVEEAAEILEPSLLAALTPSLQHLILIGDHKQLRPSLDTYELRKKYDFDKSMMERLIDAKFPYVTLAKQNRMRPEFAALLKDIYPDLQNGDQVSQNRALKCMAKSMYFWSHSEPESKARSVTNEREADRVVSVVRYLVWNGCDAGEITVLAGYLGQTKVLREKLRKASQSIAVVKVQTIDMYQGDENKYIVVSLVRSNCDNSIGFMKEWNRRCVAQSRAKCGMYFVGNMDVFKGARDSPWPYLIDNMNAQGCVGTTLPLCCDRHPTPIYQATGAQDVNGVIDHPERLCKEVCGEVQPCRQHRCKRRCQPHHEHEKCREIVQDVFPKCGHEIRRECCVPIAAILCKQEVRATLPCGHDAMKECHKDSKLVVCYVQVRIRLPECGHLLTKECHEKNIPCPHPCEETNSCGEHRCQAKCGAVRHEHEACQTLVDYTFPRCEHQSPKKKKCSEEITWKCEKTVYFDCKYGHTIQKRCHQSKSDVICEVKPCGRILECGHPCRLKCGEPCAKGDCQGCRVAQQAKMKTFREQAEKKAKEIEAKLKKKDVPPLTIDEISKEGPTAAEYQKVHDAVMKFIQECHNWFPTVTKIEKIINLSLEKKFEEAKARAFGDHIDTKFHGTSVGGVKGITENGFRMPDQNAPAGRRGMYGQGIYFATDSSKSAQQMYTKNSNMLLFCQVLLGKTLDVKQADPWLDKKKLKASGCDSVYARRGTAVKNDEFVIFDPDQALPQYIIHFDENGVSVPHPSTVIRNAAPFLVKKLKASRQVDFTDPFQNYYRNAEAHFLRMSALGQPPLAQKIDSIDIVINKNLEAKFEATKTRFKKSGIPDHELFVYHGTNSANIDSILEHNLDMSYARRQAYGRGNYFSEYPQISLGYGDGLLLCRVLPGKEFTDSSGGNIPQRYNSKKVLLGNRSAGNANASGDMIIIENSDQILPFFVFHLC